MTDVRNTLKERGSVYGSFSGNAKYAQGLKAVWDRSPGRKRLDMDCGVIPERSAVVNEAIHMIMHKLARACNGDPFYIDNFVDIAGYAQLVVDYLQSEKTADTTEALCQSEVKECSLTKQLRQKREEEEKERRIQELERRQEQTQPNFFTPRWLGSTDI